MRPPTRREQIDRGYPELARLFQTLAQPMRVRILNALGGRVASPSTIAEEIEEPLPNVIYHVRRLRDAGCIELVAERRTARSIEHLYRVAPVGWLPQRELTADRRARSDGEVEGAIDALVAIVEEAIAAGVFEHELECHVHHQPMLLDEEGARELRERVARMASEVDAVARGAAERTRRAPGGPTTAVEIALARVPARADGEAHA